MGHLYARVVVDTGSVSVEHLAPERLFRRADVADAFEQLVKVVAAARSFESLIVQGEAFDDVFAQATCGSDTKLGAAVRADSVANRDDDVEVVVVDLVRLAVGGSCATTDSRWSSSSLKMLRMWREITDLRAETAPSSATNTAKRSHR